MALTHIAHSTKIPASRRHRPKHLAQVERSTIAEKGQRAGRRQKNLIRLCGPHGPRVRRRNAPDGTGREPGRSQCQQLAFLLKAMYQVATD
jgi:hypothetical protein